VTRPVKWWPHSHGLICRNKTGKSFQLAIRPEPTEVSSERVSFSSGSSIVVQLRAVPLPAFKPEATERIDAR
jgi:hypothetical protein